MEQAERAMPDLDPGAVWVVAADLERLGEWCPAAATHVAVEDWNAGSSFTLVMPEHSEEEPVAYTFHVAGVPHEATATLRYDGPVSRVRRFTIGRELARALEKLEDLARAERR